MKKTRLSTILLLVLTLLCSIFIFASCDGNDHTHNYSSEWSKDGSYHWQACSGCEEIRNKAEHDWNSGVVTLQPTNTNEGTRTYTCNACGQTRVESFPVLDTHEHAFSDLWSSNETHHWHAATCEHAEEKKDYNEHSWNSGEITTSPTETDKGVKTFTCSGCSKTRTESVPALGDNHTHDFNKQVATENYLKDAATCTRKAVYYYSCTCGTSGTATFEYGNFTDHEYSNAWSHNDTHHWHAATCEHSSEKNDNGEHNWNSGVVTTEPTTTSTGVKTFTCQSCGKTKTEDVPKLEEAHTHTYDQLIPDNKYIESAATCTAKATYFKSCSCGLKGTETFEHGSLASHTFTTYSPNENATCTKDGTKTATCDVCRTATDEVSDVGSAKGHAYSTEWTSNDTHHWHLATCGHSSEKKDNGEHDWDTGIITKTPTNIEKGEKTFTCTICSKTKIEDVSINGATIVVSSKSVNKGENVEIVVSIYNNPGIWSALLEIEIDANVFEFVSYDISSSIFNDFGECGFDSNDNKFKFNGQHNSVENNVTKDGVMFKITLKAKDNIAEKSSNLMLDIIEVINVDMQDILLNKIDGNITIEE